MATETITEEMVTENKDWRMTHEENRVNSLKGWPLSRGKCVKTEVMFECLLICILFFIRNIYFNSWPAQAFTHAKPKASLEKRVAFVV